MKPGRKCVSLLIAVTMFLALCTPFAQATEKNGTIFLDESFEANTIGQAPPKSEDGWTGNAINNIACLYVTEEENGNKMLKAYHGDPEGEPKVRTPRVEKKIPAQGLTNLTIEYDVLHSGGATKMDVRFSKADVNESLGSLEPPFRFEEWTHIRIECDMKKKEATIYANDKRQQTSSFDLAGEGSFRIFFMFMVDPDGSWMAIDNVKISTTDTNLQVGESASGGDFNAENAKPESGDGLTVFMDSNYENDLVDLAPQMSASGWSMSAINNVACLKVTQTTDGNKELRAYHGDPAGTPTHRTPRVEKLLPTDGLTNFTIDYDVRTSGGDNKLVVNFVTTADNVTIAQLNPPFRYTEWTHIKIRCDVKKKTAVIYVNGKEHAKREIDVGDAESFKVRFMFTVQPTNDWISIDNVKMTSTDENPGASDESMVGYDGVTINWRNVKVARAEKTGMLEVLRPTHPRIFVTDWQKIADKVQTDENARVWYNKVISTAEGMLVTEPVKYYRNERNNINNCSTQFKVSIVPLAAAYCLTKDARYKQRIYQELEHVASWPDWGADAYLCTAHIILGYAVCYDWLYDDWTEEERKNIAGWLMQKGMSEAVLAYEEYNKSVNINQRPNNWNNVCNGSNLIGALALADEYPEMADYVLRKAANALPYSFHELTKDGAYCEPLNYWDYGIRHQVKLMSALDTALADGKSLPACLDFKNITGMENTGDFPIYYNGTTGSFNYGDATPGLVVSPIMYYLANKYNKPQYAWYAQYMPANNLYTSQYSGKDATLALLWYDPNNNSIEENGFALDKFYQSDLENGTNGISMRSSWENMQGLFVAMNGGDASASHANMDAGGFVLDWAGKRFVHMYGREPASGIVGGVYSWPKYHTKSADGHYQYYHCRAEANNTIIANPVQDMPDMQMGYYAELLRGESGTNTAYGIIDMTQTNADYTDAKRGIMLTNHRSVVVLQDEITAKKPSEFYWFVNTKADITIASDGKSALWELGGERMLVRITQGPADAKFAIMQAQPLPTSPDPDVQPDLEEHKMYIHVQNVTNLNLTVEFVPLTEGEGIPAPQPILPMAQWCADVGASPMTSQSLGDIVALKVDNPNAYAKGKKTYVDTANLDIKPIVQNGRTLVPVRFIAEKFGANVGWADVTQTVTVKTRTKTITLQIGSDSMYVDGQAVTLDVPAQTIGGRTLIPLRALVEALGKEVFWDDRGLIIISERPVDYDATKIDRIVALLDTRILCDGLDIKHFDSEIYTYAVEIEKDAAVPEVSVLSDLPSAVVQGNPATVTIGDQTYTIHFTENPFSTVMGTGSDGVLKTLYLKTDRVAELPAQQTYLSVAGVTASTEWNEKYPQSGTIDGVISEVTQNRWSAEGVGNWICYDLGAPQKLHSIAIAGYRATTGRSYTFEIALSDDGVNFEVVQPEAVTDGVSDRSIFSLGDKTARYIKIIGKKTSNTTWVGINEVRIYADAAMEQADQDAWIAYFYKDAIIGKVGESATISVVGESKGGAVLAIDLSEVEFSSADASVAIVDAAGHVKLLKAGSTVIYAKIDVMGITKTASITVNVE